jgi:CRP-like cAMP-binding protein
MPEPNVATSAWLEIALSGALQLLGRNTGLDAAGQAWLRHTTTRVETYHKGAMLLAGGSERQLKLIVSGWAAETRVLADSRRQICALHLPGDIITPRLAGPATLYGVTALTKLECLDLAPALEAPECREKAAVRRALLHALNLNEERRYEHIVRLGQHTASERMIHLLFELRDRLTAPGAAPADSYRLPLTQEDLADSLGLSVVHINRTLRRLRALKLLDIRFGGVTLMQPHLLRDIIKATRTA